MLMENQVALVTGAGGGIGRAIADAMAAEGAFVVAADLNLDAAQETVRGIGQERAVAQGLDVTSFEECSDLRASLVEQQCAVSVLVNCAGIVRRGPLDGPNALDDWDSTMRVNVTAAFHLARVFAHDIGERQGSIINVGSIQSFVHTRANSIAYTTSKHAVAGMTTSMAVELGPTGVRVNGVAPGVVETDLNRAALAASPERRAIALDRTALGRFNTVGDVARVTVFLASHLASGVTGVMIPVDNGYLST